MPKPRNTCPPEQILAVLPDDLRAVTERAREIMREALPDVAEAGYPGWRLVGYRLKKYIGFIAPAADEVRIGFERGVTLPDPQNILEGEGKQVRYVAARTLEDLEAKRAALITLIEIAAAQARGN